jgi:hypothetical protein
MTPKPRGPLTLLATSRKAWQAVQASFASPCTDFAKLPASNASFAA